MLGEKMEAITRQWETEKAKLVTQTGTVVWRNKDVERYVVPERIGMCCALYGEIFQKSSSVGNLAHGNSNMMHLQSL